MAILTVFSPQKIEETGGNMRVIITIALFIGGCKCTFKIRNNSDFDFN